MDRIDHALLYASSRIKKQLASPRTCVYVLGCDGYVKIGIARNARERVMNLQVGSPHKIEFLGMFYTLKPKEDERDLHAEFKEFRKTGEWFKLDQDKLSKLLRKACYALE